MANNLRVFNTNSEYQSADLVHPAVSYVIETDKVHYEPTTPTPSFKWKAAYSDSHVESAECGGSSEIVNGEINLTNLVSVEIGDYCVTSIGYRVFYNCSGLTNVTIPDAVTSIGGSAFQLCRNLTNINIPSGVTFIGDYAFGDCYKLSNITIPSGFTYINNGMFQDCRSLTSVTIPSGVTSIGVNAFNGCSGLTSIDIPNGVTSIGDNAFNGCRKLTSITVNAITPPTLGTNAPFGNTNNCPIYVPSQSVEAYKSAYMWSDYASRIYPIP